MQHVSAERALRNRLDQVAREAAAQNPLEFDLEYFALQLLAGLFGLAAQIVDLPLHARDLHFLFRDLGPESFLGVEPCLVADGDERILHLLLDREVDFAPRIVELALLAKHIRLGLLRRCELLAVGGENLLHLCQPLVAFSEFVGQRQTGPLGLRFGDLGTLGLQLRRHALVDGFPGLRKLLLGLSELRFALAKLLLLRRKLALEAPLGLRDQRGGEGFGQLDRGAAIRADDLWVGHWRGPRIGVAPLYRRLGIRLSIEVNCPPANAVPACAEPRSRRGARNQIACFSDLAGSCARLASFSASG